MPTPADSARAARPTALFLAALAAACGPRAPEIEHVILVSLDTVRADRTSLASYPRPTTPFLASLAERGVVFDDHVVHSNNTLSSHASILTGLLPRTHDVFDHGTPGVAGSSRALAPGLVTLAEAFRGAGFATLAVTSHPHWLTREFGFDQGFDDFESGAFGARDVRERLAARIAALRPRRLFAFAHLFDAHSDPPDGGLNLPYRASPELVDAFAGAPPAGFTGCLPGRDDCCAARWLRAIEAGAAPPPREQLEYVSALYDAGLRALDDELALLFADLERLGILERALVLVTSDHGEEFLEHGRFLHGGLHDEVMRVPMLLVPPRGSTLGVGRISLQTQAIDIAPTLLELAGLAPIGQGRSLVPLLDGASALAAELGARPAMFETSVLRGRDAHSAYKYASSKEAPALYDLDADPGESQNLLADPATRAAAQVRAQAIERELARLRLEARRLGELLRRGDAEEPQLDADELEQMRDLGYF